jgi:hypothetical protein
MTRAELAGWATAVAAAIYALLLALWLLRRFLDRWAARRLPELTLDPYTVVAARQAAFDGDVQAAAAAALLLAGLITVTGAGRMAVTERGSDPAHVPRHPVEAAVLEAVRNAAPQVFLSKLETPELHRWLPMEARRKGDGVRRAAILTALLLSLCWTILFVYLGDGRPTGVGGYLASLLVAPVIWALAGVPLVWLVIKVFPRRRDLFQELCTAQPPHPALAALDDDSRRRLHASRWYRTPEERAAAQPRSDWDTGMDTY